MYSIEKLEKILNEKVYSIEETSYGVTNNNFIVTTNKNKYFYRTSKDSTKIVKLEFPNVKVSNVEATNLDGAGGMTKELTAYYDKVAQTPVKITFENYHDA